MIPSGDVSNDYVRGEAFLNEDGSKPNVIFVHGGRMKGFDRVKKIFHNSIMNNLGWNMYYYTLPYHLERQPEASLYSGEFMVSVNINRTVKRDKTAKVGITLGWDVYIDRTLFHSIRYVDFCNSLFRCHL